MRWKVGLVVAIATVSGLSGCGGGPRLVPVSGNVTLNGKPLGEAGIVFLPDASNPDGLAGNDQTGPAGNYKAMTQGRAGLVPGKYKVFITKKPVETSKVSEQFKDDPYMAQLVASAGEEINPGRSGAASKRPTEITGEFSGEVPPGGGVLDFDVKAAVSKD